MSVIASDIQYRLSGGAANADPSLSLGGAKSSVQIQDAVDNNLFDDVSGDEHAAGDVEYRCLYIHNGHATDSLLAAKVWIASDSSGADSDLSIGVGTAAVGAVEQTVANEGLAPSGVTFSDAAVSRVTGLSLGTLPAGSHKAVWLRRTISPGTTPQAADTAQIQAGGDTL
jgi:hypothetical protein